MVAAAFTDEVGRGDLVAARAALAGHLRVTPVVEWPTDDAVARLGPGTTIAVKLEFLQHAGCFKPRGALLHLRSLTPAERARGVVAASAGNHAASVAFAAHATGVSAKVIVPRAVSPARLALCHRYGAEVVLADDIHAAFAEMQRLVADEQRVAIPSFDSAWMLRGAADLAAELAQQAGALDLLVVSVGGGALCGGSVAAMRLLQPRCAVYGVEPRGADTMTRSLATGQPQRLTGTTVADSLAAPYASERTLAHCQRAARVVTVDDDAILAALRAIFANLRLAVEPAAAAGLAALTGPLADVARGKRIGLVMCGANLDAHRYAALLTES